MKVYVLSVRGYEEGEEILGIYSDSTKAAEARDRALSKSRYMPDMVEILDWELDAEEYL